MLVVIYVVLNKYVKQLIFSIILANKLYKYVTL